MIIALVKQVLVSIMAQDLLIQRVASGWTGEELLCGGTGIDQHDLITLIRRCGHWTNSMLIKSLSNAQYSIFMLWPSFLKHNSPHSDHDKNNAILTLSKSVLY